MEERGIIHQVLVKLLDGKHRTLNFTSPLIPVEALKDRIQLITSIPSHLQLLLLSNSPYPLYDHQTLKLTSGSHQILESPCGSDTTSRFPLVVNLLLRLRGGKGGFGSLLRGAATKAGQKKTNNFDACRDMSGRRLRHVNAEKKLEEWRAEAEERKLEKVAEDFIKKKTKEMVKKGINIRGGDNTEKYVEKYRKDSAKCMEEVEKSVRESLKGLVSSKRKGSDLNESESKKMRIWLGKRKLAHSDSDTDEDDDDGDSDKEENETSIVIDSGNHSDSSVEPQESSDSVTGKTADLISSSDGLVQTLESSAEEGNGKLYEKSPDSIATVDADKLLSITSATGRVSCNGDASCLGVSFASENETALAEEVDDTRQFMEADSQVTQASIICSIGERNISAADVDCSKSPKLITHDEQESVEVSNLEKPLNFDNFNCAAELEALGLEKLKSELQSRGLKCGGTLQERAARLFLLKTTPVEMLPKKLLAKK